jgi:hypothetical protein
MKRIIVWCPTSPGSQQPTTSLARLTWACRDANHPAAACRHLGRTAHAAGPVRAGFFRGWGRWAGAAAIQLRPQAYCLRRRIFGRAHPG